MNRDAYERMAVHQGQHWWFVGRRSVLEALLRSLRLPNCAHILEVGCGPGGNLSLLQRFGQVDAVESDLHSRITAGALSGLPVRDGRLPDELDLGGQRYDLICLFDVLEHIKDDQSALQALSQHLKPGGRLLITVPAYAWLYSQHDERHHHHRRYTARSLRDTAARAGWSAARVGYFNSLLFPIAAAKRLAERVLRRSLGDDDIQPAPRVNRLLTALFSLEARWSGLHLLPAGLSVAGVFTVQAG
ncbi:MAG: class I SAM-dependent methyltransferase [Leptothrix sp. (in: b-proteobacteria)]